MMRVGHYLHAAHYDRKALDKEARRRRFDPSIGAEVALSLAEAELVMWNGDESETGKAVRAGLRVAIEHLRVPARRP